MARQPRKLSGSGYYHVMQRGIDKQDIFYEEEDYALYLKSLQRAAKETGVKVVAYCLMSNHTHLLLWEGEKPLSLMMKKLGVLYVSRFNRKYERNGHLFQDRFQSEAVEDEQYLLTVIRYIHQNPEKAGMCSAREYPFSSYAAYVSDRETWIDNSMPLQLMNGPQGFLTFMQTAEATQCLEIDSGSYLSEQEALATVLRVTELENPLSIAAFAVKERNEMLKKCKKAGVTVRQLSRLTGLNRNIVQRA